MVYVLCVVTVVCVCALCVVRKMSNAKMHPRKGDVVQECAMSTTCGVWNKDPGKVNKNGSDCGVWFSATDRDGLET